MTYWTLGQAAKETGRSKSLLHKALKSGRLSFVSKDSSGYKIDPAELYRVFPQEHTPEVEKERLDTPEDTLKTLLYEQKIAFLEEQLEVLQGQLEKSDTREQQHLALLNKQGLMLEHLSQAEAEKPKKRGFWLWPWK
jgi:hypothetical protein